MWIIELNIYFNRNLMNISIGAPQLFSEVTEGYAAYVHLERIIIALGYQSILALPCEYLIEVRYDKNLNFIRVQCFKGNEVAYTYDYGSPVMYNGSNQPQDMKLLEETLSNLGFNCVINNKEKQTSLKGAEKEVRLSLVS